MSIDITVIKRDGTEEDFSENKIAMSIFSAANEAGGDDFELAEELTEQILEIIDSGNFGDEISTATLQEMVEKILIETGHTKTAKAYILNAADRARIREMDSSLMKSFEDITFTSPEESDMKRENANIDTSTAMGTMLKYGSEGAKTFNLLHMVSKDIADAHIAGDIHIHDLDFLTLTETCIDKNTLLTVKINEVETVITAEQLADYVKLDNVDEWKNIDNVKVLSNGNYVQVKSMVKHNSDNKRMMNIVTPTGELHVTDEHTISVIENDRVVDKKVSTVKVGDILSIPKIDTKRYVQDSIDIISLYTGDNLIISNTDEVLDNIRYSGNWKAFCSIFSYDNTRCSAVSAGHSKMTIQEYKNIEHLCSLKHSDLTISYKRSRGKETINAVVPLTFELGNVIGLMYAEGSVTEHKDKNQKSPVKKACFCNYDEELIDQFNRNYSTVFNNPKIRDRKHNGKHTGSVLSGYLQYELFHGVFGTKNSTDDIKLAQWMFNANREFVNGLIAGLIDGDGTVQNDGYRVTISSVSKNFLQDIQKLLLLRGITSAIKSDSSATAGTVATFTRDDGSVVQSVRKSDCYRLEFTGNLYTKLAWINSNKLSETTLNSSDKFPYKQLTITEINEVEYSGYVYDLETEDSHFTADGFNVHNCCQIPLDRLFKGGFNTGHGFLREPGSIRAAGALAAIAIQSNQNDQHGGQSIPLFDYYLAPYVALTYVKNLANIAMIKFDLNDDDYRNLKNKLVAYQRKHKLVMNDRCLGELRAIISDYLDSLNVDYTDKQIDKLFERADKATYDDTYQAMEAFVHNLNSMHSRAGSQVPFSSVNFGTDTSTEGRYVSKTLLETTDRGLGNGEIAIFPISIFKLKEGVNFNPGDPNYGLFKLSCKVSSHRLYPNFCNLDAPFNAEIYNGTPETEMATMGCRTRVGTNKYNPANTVVPGRGNLSFTSINLPRIAILADHDINKFYEILDKRLELVHRQLLERFDVQCLKKPINYPFLMGQGIWIDSDRLRPKDDIREVLRNGTFGVGFIGLAETLTALIGKHHGESEEAQKLGLEIVNHMKEYCDAWSEHEHMNYAVIGTPAESLSGRFVRMDKVLFGEIPGVTDKDYYTNSSHVPVSFKISATDKVDIEAPYHALELGGHICYIEMDGDPTKNLKAFMNIVRYMHDKGVGYCAINHPVDRDPVCGYTGIIGDVCPRCGRRENEPMTMEMYERIKGYANVGNADTLGVHGNPAEEADRVSNN